VDPKLFGPRLKELRERAGMSQKALADKAGISQSAIAHWEQGLREPSWSNVLALASALGVDCLAFQQPPAVVPEPKRGRPKKAEGEMSAPPRKQASPKRRGRPTRSSAPACPYRRPRPRSGRSLEPPSTGVSGLPSAAAPRRCARTG